MDEPTGKMASFRTDVSDSVADIREMVVAHVSLIIAPRDCKSIVGAGRRQMRVSRTNAGASHICRWTFTMTESWAWGRPKEELVDRSDSPSDSPSHRLIHADKRRAWSRARLGERIRAVPLPGVTEPEIHATAERPPILAP
ncbi:hypothetical protein SAMN05444166_2483 [Singulisphaera sp. GP187]|uniref:hypothetical protein n=1 Tax=Singulisphaera sp. GP187 TaxID=1882752 RepID=UPI00092841FD|nr:hypothetical protein [Singulisphaera sp. GP187]SIO10722.1 hypothetical protein SAMN05444166_2483 [Singulisphaera sp. GP187]